MILKKEIEEDTNKWKIYCVHGSEELTSLKCPYYPKQSIDSIPIKIPMTYFTELEQIFF